MNFRRLPPMVFALVLLALAVVPVGAQAPQSSLTLNAYQCPADYDEVSDCVRLGGVAVSVKQDGQEIGPLTTLAAEGVSLDLLRGTAIRLEIIGGQPEATVLEASSLAFDAAEGVNAVTLVFLEQEGVEPPPHSGTNALVVETLVCPEGYAGDNYVRDCLGKAGIDITVTRAWDAFSVAGTTGADGIAAFQGLGEGDYRVSVEVAARAAVLTVCGTSNGFEPRQLTNPDTNSIVVYIGPAEELTCTFFAIPPAGEKTSGGGVVVEVLPNTGSGPSVDRAWLDAGWMTLGMGVLISVAGSATLRRARILR
jgi:hypothetical protein